MRQICTSRKVWLPILLLFTAVLIFACWDRGVSIDYDGTGWLCAVPDDGTAVEIPVSFHGTLRRGTYTGSCDIPGVLSSVINHLAEYGANILTINQNIPSDGVAAVTVSIRMTDVTLEEEQLIQRLRALKGVVRVSKVS